MSIGPAHIAAARTAVTLTGALTRAIGAVASEATAIAKPTFEQIFAAQADQPATEKSNVSPLSVVEQLTERVKSLLSGSKIELDSAVTFILGADGNLKVDGDHPQRNSIETAIAHDQSVEELVNQWIAAKDESARREPMRVTIAPSFDRSNAQ